MTNDPKETAAAVASATGEQAGNVASAAKDQAASVAGTAKDQAVEVANTATDAARSLFGEAQTELTAQASAQKDRAVTGLRALANDLSSMTKEGDERGIAHHVVAEAARRSGTVADYLEKHEPGHLLDDLRDLGRRRTGGFLVGAALLGFAGGRLLKGSKTELSEPADMPAPALAVTPADTEVLHDTAPTPGERFGALGRTPHLLSDTDV